MIFVIGIFLVMFGSIVSKIFEYGIDTISWVGMALILVSFGMLAWEYMP
jgi:hypothetical protein